MQPKEREKDQYVNLKYNEKMSLINGIYSIFAMNLVIPFTALFAINVLNVSDREVALMDSLSGLAGMIALIPGAYWLNRLQQKKHFTGMSILISRMFFLLLVFVPFLPFSNVGLIFVILVALMQFPSAIAGLAWQDFIADLVPEKERNKFFSNRNRMIKLVGLAVTLLSGIALSIFSKDNPWPFQFFFFLAFIFGVIEVRYLYLHREPLVHKKIEKLNLQKFISGMKSIFTHKPYILFLVSSLIFHFGWQMAWPLFKIYHVRFAEANSLWISIFEVCNGLVAFATFRWWGRFADAKGNNIALVLTALGIATAPFLYSVSTNLYYLAAVNLWTGFSVAGITLILFNRLLEVSPNDNRSTYIALFQLVIGISAIFAPLVGVSIYESTNSIVTAFHTSGYLRLVGVVAFFAVTYIMSREKKNV